MDGVLRGGRRVLRASGTALSRYAGDRDDANGWSNPHCECSRLGSFPGRVCWRTAGCPPFSAMNSTPAGSLTGPWIWQTAAPPSAF